MRIKTLDEMDKIVQNNPELHWEGWTVVRLQRDDYAEYLSVGTKRDGQWYKRTEYLPDSEGWEIPPVIVK